MSDRKQKGGVDLLGQDYDTSHFRDRTELRSCPFCGGSPITFGKPNEETGIVTFTAKCPNILCDAEIRASSKDAETAHTEAVTRWNRRKK